MVTSACDRGTAPTGATTSLTGGFERLRLRPHSEPTCSLGTRRDTSRRCGGLATVPSASVVLHVDARQEPERLTMAGYSEGVLLRLAVMRQDGTVNDFLFTYLDSIDERLLEYLDEDDELKLDAVKRLRFYTSALLEGSISPEHVMEDWPDWYQLAPAFVATYGSDELQELEGAAVLLEAIEEQDDVSLTDADLVYLRTLEEWLGMYPEMRTTEE
jgi:hypothetical protein